MISTRLKHLRSILFNRMRAIKKLNILFIDIDHNISKFNIMSGAFIIEKVYTYCPSGTLFICIIDPGVGSQREALCVQFGEYTFFGPNNGLLSAILKQDGARTFRIDENSIRPASYTFHGRDLFVPAATRFAQGSRDFLIPWNKDQGPVLLAAKDKNFVAYIDSFGNIKTTIAINKPSDDHVVHIMIAGKSYTIPFVRTFSETPIGTLLCYRGSNETLEIAVNLGSAQQRLQAHVGDEITLIAE